MIHKKHLRKSIKILIASTITIFPSFFISSSTVNTNNLDSSKFAPTLIDIGASQMFGATNQMPTVLPTPTDNDILSFLSGIAPDAHKDVINELVVGTRSTGTTVTVNITVNPRSRTYTGTTKVTYLAPTTTDLSKLITISNLKQQIYGDLWTDQEKGKQYLMDDLKTECPDLNLNQIKLTLKYTKPLTNYGTKKAQLIIEPISAWSYYTGSKTLDFSFVPTPDYVLDNAKAIYHGGYNDGFGVGTDGKHQWFNSVTGLQTVNYNSATFNGNHATITNSTGATSGFVTEFVQTDVINAQQYFTFEVVFKPTAFQTNNAYESDLLADWQSGGFGIDVKPGAPGSNVIRIGYFPIAANGYTFLELTPALSVNNVYSFSVTNDGNGLRAYLNGNLTFSQSKPIAFTLPGATHMAIATDPSGTAMNTNTTLTGDYYCVRLYNQPITETQIKHNYTIDHDLYNIPGKINLSDILATSLNAPLTNDLWKDDVAGRNYLLQALKREYPQLDTAQIEVQPNFTSANFTNCTATMTVKGTSASVRYSTNAATVKFNFTPVPGYVTTNAVAIYHGAYNAGLGNHTNGDHNWFNCIDGSSTTGYKNASFTNNYASLSSVNYGGFITPYTQSQIMTNFSFTYEIVFKPTAFGTGEQNLLSNWEQGGFGTIVSTPNGPGPICFRPHIGGYQTYEISGPISLNQIYSLSMTNNNVTGGKFTAYVNGKKTYEMPALKDIAEPRSSTHLGIGNNPSGASVNNNTLTGNFYTVRVYNKAISEDDVLRNYGVDQQYIFNA